MNPIGVDEQVEALREVIEAGILQVPTGGPAVSRLEREFAEYLGVAHGVGASSGTAALAAALVALDVGPGDEVIVPGFTFVASATAVAFTGARPVFADVDARTLCLDVEDARSRVSERTKAIMPVHLFGHPADVEGTAALAAEHGFAVLEDCCQGHGATHRGRKVGSIGDLGCFSFSKRHLISCGGGGLVTTSDDELAERSRRATFHGIGSMDQLWANFRDYDLRGFNFGMSEFFAALALLQIRKLDEYVSHRAAIAAIFDEALSGLRDELELPAPATDGTSCFHNYPLRVAAGSALGRDELADLLRAAGVSLLINLVSLTEVTVFARGRGREPLPVSEDVGRRIVILDLDHSWSLEEAAVQAERVRTTVERMLVTAGR